MHVVDWLWEYLDTASRICTACTCKEFYGKVSESWKDVVIPEWIPINDENLMPILICCQNIESLTINFPFNVEEERASEALIMTVLKEYQKHAKDVTNNDEDEKALQSLNIETENNTKNNKKKIKRIKYPAKAINPSYLPHLKNVKKIDVKSCGSNSFNSFIIAFILHLSKFVTLRHLCVPQLFTIRHNCIETLDVHQLQIGFDGMNVHLGADLIGITHFKKQLPNMKTINVDELYLFIGEEIYLNNQKSGKQYWIVMRKWCQDVGINVFFKSETLTIMLMPRGHQRKTPPLHYQKWSEFKEWLQDRLGNFIQNVNDEIEIDID